MDSLATRKLLYGGVFFANGGRLCVPIDGAPHRGHETRGNNPPPTRPCRTQPGNRQRGPAPIRGQAKAEEMVVLKRCKMRSPGVSRPIRRQLNIEDRRAVRQWSPKWCVDGENLIAEIKHQRL